MELQEFKNEIATLKAPEVTKMVGTIVYDLAPFTEKVKALVEAVKKEDVTRDSIADFKDLKAKLNKFSKEINDEKIKIVREFTAPVDEFTNAVKNNIALLKDGVNHIDKQLKKFEEQEKQLLKEEYEQLWDSLGYGDKVTYIRIENTRWYNKAMSKAKVKDDMMKLVAGFEKDINNIKINVDNEEEATNVIKSYYGSLDVNKELGEYRKWKNTIVAKPEIVVKEVEKVVEVTTPKNDEKPLEPIFEAENKETVVEGNGEWENLTFNETTVKEDKIINVTMNFNAPESLVDEIESLLKKNGVVNPFIQRG